MAQLLDDEEQQAPAADDDIGIQKAVLPTEEMFDEPESATIDIDIDEEQPAAPESEEL
jgi:hypothetical protein